jgi:hypothetical protein
MAVVRDSVCIPVHRYAKMLSQLSTDVQSDLTKTWQLPQFFDCSNRVKWVSNF